jgi:hypothetical protein
MAVLVIPTDTEQPFFTQRTRMSDADYTLVFRYNFREERYYMDILDAEESPIVLGVKLLTNWKIFRYYKDPRMPAGELIVTTLTKDVTPPKLGELGEGMRTELTYFEPDEA